MSVQLNRVVPWGRSLDEYRRMFGLTDDDLQKKIVGCGDGPASFNAEMTRFGHPVISFDPLYAFSGGEIQKRFDESIDEVLDQVRRHPQNYVWDYYIERITGLEAALARKPQALQIDLIGTGEIPADAALLIRSVLMSRSPKTRIITNARSSLQNGSVLVWLLGDHRIIRDDARLYFRRATLSEDDAAERECHSLRFVTVTRKSCQ